MKASDSYKIQVIVIKDEAPPKEKDSRSQGFKDSSEKLNKHKDLKI
jgi:hypothetical protein